jgi:hypothetical protein
MTYTIASPLDLEPTPCAPGRTRPASSTDHAGASRRVPSMAWATINLDIRQQVWSRRKELLGEKFHRLAEFLEGALLPRGRFVALKPVRSFSPRYVATGTHQRESP